MLPEEVARYDEHWLDVAEKISNEALDNQIDFIKNDLNKNKIAHIIIYYK